MREQRLMVISIAASLCAGTVMSIIALSTQQWIVQDLHGRVTYGLTHECYEKPFTAGNPVVCEAYTDPPGEWSATLAFLIIGTLWMMVAAVLAIQSFSRRSKLSESRKYGIAASVIYAIAALIFPGGFDYYAIGGSPYRLPDNAEIGYSYIMFVVTLIFVFVSQLMTMKVLFEDFLP
eukprot:m.78536 g.78536  ORF g.78536 m.78536 type:complete len:177 (-) comp9222_c0_seq4:1532-2062(-)